MKIQRLIPVLGLLLIVQVALVVWLWRDVGTAPVHADGPLLVVKATAIDRIVISDADRRVVLDKVGDHWQLPGSYDFPAGQFQVENLLQSLVGLKPGLALATSAEAARRFRVADDRFERRIQLLQSGQVLSTLYLGDAAGPRRVYGRVAGDTAIYPLAFSAFQAEAKEAAWTDKTWLHRDPARITVIQLGELQLTRHGDQWLLEGMAEGEATDQAAVADLLATIANLNFMAVAGRVDQVPFGQPLLTLTLTLSDGTAMQYQFTDPGQQGDPLLRISDAGFVVRIASFVFKPLQEISRDRLLVVAEPLEAESKSDTAPQDDVSPVDAIAPAEDLTQPVE